ncbi:hypothetical protein JR316_0004504 [Psilocybe cubensis]|uniref:Uncharacterized protein n=1 Tax=Psilocybe cubensis TaxID=181762 RepID=A0ACB8H5C4_PSICU|nr:hypothetical protein JR316_0004504 [Psilocybe cubensis]KAH9482404.1 hypothetical protein JR316_0004504 [Psilocybe cubensis]
MDDQAIASGAVSDLDTRVAPLNIPTTSSSTTSENKSAGEEQALESHEVIELQTFSDRKAWIEDKIKFLESLPPIDVFAGLEALKSSSEDIPGLPTRLELQRWVTEHDAIEKETEIFDTGELTKLRQLTKAATQRNLSPEDTDVIELTLTTIYGLDKLLHLLRDRSENLEMMAIRLTWEESRQQSWKERRQIIQDLETFSTSRARWNPSIYDTSTKMEEAPTLSRRASNASLASVGSDNTANSRAFSRTARFKLAEMLSRDAAQFSGRVTGLKHGKVAAAGKALDKLIDHSRKPVPDELLDEQDRLEEKCINEMENISKFTMNLVMQWRKADEVYVETMKDHTAASNLLEEIEIAKLHHPTARQSASFVSRIDTILKRLAVRGDPSAAASSFPHPEHPLLPDQKAANEALVRTLSNEIDKANQLAKKVDGIARDFRTAYEAVKRAEALVTGAEELSSTLSSFITKLEEGISTDEGDGSSPDLSTDRCLDPTRHSVFLAFLPSLLESTQRTIEEVRDTLNMAPSVLIGLELPGIDPKFKENAAVTVGNLALIRDKASSVRDSIVHTVARLRECRKISASINSKATMVKALKSQILDYIQQERWQQESGNMDPPPTPEGSTPSPFNTIGLNFDDSFLQIESQLKLEITDPLDALSANLQPQLLSCLKEMENRLQESLQKGNRFLRVLYAIREQAAAMKSTRDQFYQILSRIEDCKAQIQESIGITMGTTVDDSPMAEQKIIDIEVFEEDVTGFVNSLTHRIPFVSQHTIHRKTAVNPTSPSYMSTTYSASDVLDDFAIDIVSVDAGVRADSNTYAMRLCGELDTLKKARKHLNLAMKAKLVDRALKCANDDIDTITDELALQNSLLSSIPRNSVESIEQLISLSDTLGTLGNKSISIGKSFTPTRVVLREMDELSDVLDSSTRQSLFKSRNDAANNVELRLKNWDQGFAALKDSVLTALARERQHQEELKAAEERRQKAEAERRAAEEQERLRLEEEAKIAAEQRRILEEKLVEEQRIELERQRKALERVECERLAQEAAAAEQLALEKLEKQATATHAQELKDKLQKEEAERAKLERERIEMLAKIHEAELQLENERRLHAEREAAAVELEKERQLQMELQRKEDEAQRLAQEQKSRAQVEELVKQQKLQLEQLAQEQAQMLEIERLERHQEVEAHRINEEKSRRMKEEIEKQQETERQHIEDEKSLQIESIRAEAKRLAEEQTRRNEAELLERQHQLEKKRVDEERAAQAKIKELVESEALRAAEELAHRATLEDLTKQREAEKQRLVDELAKSETARALAEQALQMQLEQAAKEFRAAESSNKIDEADVFGNQATPNPSNLPRSKELARLQSQLVALRKRLRSIGLNEASRPSKSSSTLPTDEVYNKMQRDLSSLSSDFKTFPSDINDGTFNTDFNLLKAELEEAFVSLQDIGKLARVHNSVQACDAALSDLLEHIDSFPAAPLGVLSSSHRSVPTAAPAEQLLSRLNFTRKIVDDLVAKSESVIDDHRVRSEHSRIQQTWAELEEMANDRISGNRSRPSSTISRNSSRAGRNSNASMPAPSLPTQSRSTRKKDSYSNLSVSSVSMPSKGKMLAPPVPQTKTRRVTSGSNDLTASRSTSRLSSISSNRSVSGPLNSSLYGSTFASRQRTASLSSTVTTPTRTPSLSSRSRMASESKTIRSHSPALSEISNHSQSHSRSSLGPSRSTANPSTWSRAPRDSFSSIISRPRTVTPVKRPDAATRKKYVADPKSKLDMAVGDVVNQLPVGINVEGITESWRDQSGKYWIGNQDPKLCFCRILRSQTVMTNDSTGLASNRTTGQVDQFYFVDGVNVTETFIATTSFTSTRPSHSRAIFFFRPIVFTYDAQWSQSTVAKVVSLRKRGFSSGAIAVHQKSGARESLHQPAPASDTVKTTSAG